MSTKSGPSIWLTSDHHFGHANIIKYTGRPYADTDAMNADLVARWNRMVKPEDEVWVLGDLAMGKLSESLLLVSQLNGSKHLLPGNHDRMYGLSGVKYDNAVARYLNAGFASVSPLNDFEVMLEGVRLVLSHFPYEEDERHGDRYAKSRPTDNGLPLLHGHTHGLWRKRGRMIDVGVDAWGGYPVPSTAIAGLCMVNGDLAPVEWEAA